MEPLETAGNITSLLRAHAEGDRDAFDRLVPLVYHRLRVIAHGQLARSRRTQTLDTTALVHEAYVHLVDESGVAWQDRSHFFAVCARAMRRIVVDAARRRGAVKRGSEQAHVTLEPGLVGVEEQTELVLAVDQALTRLATFNPRLERVVECRYFAGMTDAETARAMGTSLRTTQREWTRARAWLQKELTEGTRHGA
jgi:RNA polymerase sigma factor (TIGR02999 family)